MASTGIDYPSSGEQKVIAGDEKASYGFDVEDRRGSSPSIKTVHDHTHRRLKPRHIQLIGIGGTIGTALFVQIGKGLMNGGPGSLFLAFTIWCGFILAVTISIAEMVTYLPISSPFIRFAGRFVDDSLEVAAGWNFFIFEAMMVPMEVVACNVIIHFWSDVVPTAAIIVLILVLYCLTNLLAVKWYGETEFWASLGKMLLIIGLIIFTFISMLGGNPKGDRYGFRYWRDPGSFKELYREGNLGRFLGFLQCLIQASFTIAGPDYVSMAAGETENPRKVMPRAYNAVFYRLTAFFVLGSLCVGINVPSNDPEMTNAFKNDLPGAAASPYVSAMNRLGIAGLPHVVNAMVLGAAFSAGNSYVYCASRSLYGLALEGKAPKMFTKCTKNGVPIYSVALVLLIALLSFLQLGSGSAVVLQWFVNLVTASQLINYAVCCFTFIRFYEACKAQGLNRDTLPYKGWFQPYAAWAGFVATSIMAVVGGYTVFLDDNWDIPSFLFSYMMIFVFPVLFFGWKFIKKTKFRRAHEIDLIQDLEEIEEYHRNYVPIPEKNKVARWFNWFFS